MCIFCQDENLQMQIISPEHVSILRKNILDSFIIYLKHDGILSTKVIWG
jgi:hypothetical protein